LLYFADNGEDFCCMVECELPFHGEVEPTTITQFMEKFLSRRDCFHRQLDNERGTYIKVDQSVHEGTVFGHLKGIHTIGAYALDADHQAKWLVLDADDDELWQKVLAVSRFLEQHGVVTQREQSRRGGHLWFFLSPTSGRDARRFARQLLTEHGLTDGNGTPFVEIYPKQDILRTGVGSFVRLPLGVHRAVGKRFSFVETDGITRIAPTVREQLAMLIASPLVPRPFFDAVVSRSPVKRPLPQLSPTFLERQHYHGKHLSDRVKSVISVFDFVSRHPEYSADLDRRGMGLCPFHDDHEDSFSAPPNETYWHCYACDIGGSIIDYQTQVMMRSGRYRGKATEFTDALKEVADLLIPR
jgi:hypothetical protein